MGTKTGEILCVMCRTYPYHDRNRKTLHTKHGFPLEIVSFLHSKHLFRVLFDICFGEGNMKIDSVRRSLPGDFWIIQIEWKESKESHVLGSKLPYFLFPEGINSSTLFVGVHISIIRILETNYKDYLFKGWDDHPQKKEFRPWHTC